ncbi:hypothetical protein [Paraburkholderia susongensis]|uniref:hypothetical protein n=1 Tax=Paraburkholderia susongensis TaxID=1515439 RepID=UPI00142E2ACC|nr:hypothetical protein [Paraburkholderia susongensis]
MTSYPSKWKLPRIFARSDRAGKTGGHDGRSALRDRFRGNRFDGNGELNRTGRFAVQLGNRGDLGDLRHRDNIHENRKLAAPVATARACYAKIGLENRPILVFQVVCLTT